MECQTFSNNCNYKFYARGHIYKIVSVQTKFQSQKNFLINFQIFQASVLNIRVGTKLVLDYIHGLSKS